MAKQAKTHLINFYGALHEDVAFYMKQETIADQLKDIDKNGNQVEIQEYFLETDINWLDSKDQL